MGYTYAALNRLEEAGEHVAWMRASAPEAPYTGQIEALVDAVNRERQRALSRLSTIDVAPLDAHYKFHLAESFAMSGDEERALDLFERAVAEGFYPYRFYADYCPFLVPLKGTKRFTAVLDQARRRAEEFQQELRALGR